MKRTGKVRRILWAWIVTLAAAMIVLGSSFVLAGTFDAWNYRLKITFSGYDPPGGGELLTNFPTLVILSTNIDGFSYTNFESDTGNDLRFAGSNKITELNYEIEQWDTNGSSFVWVQVPELESTNEFIYAYWGMNTNAPAYATNGATWSNGYIGVWHMSQTNAQDSTINGHHGSAQGAVLNVSSGAIGRANEFDADVDYISVPDSDDFTLSGDYSVSAWINSDAISDWEAFVGTYDVAGFMMVLGNDANNTLYFWDGDGRSSEAPIPDGEWKHVVYTREGTAGILYIDGTNVKTRADAQQTGDGGDLELGGGGISWANYRFDGTVDEVRISSIARGSNWVWACWLNQTSNNVFANYGDAEPNATNLTVITKPVSNIGVTNATLNGKVLHTGDAENPHVYFCLGLTNAGTLSTGDWDRVEYMGTNWGKGEMFATNLTGLISGSNYHYRCYVTNSTGEDWSDDAQSFTTIYLPSVTNTGATSVWRQVATLRGEITDTGLDTPYVWFYYWIDGNSSTSPVAMGLQSGAFSEYVTGLTMATNYTYKILASNMAGTVWSGEKSFETLPFGTGTNIWTGEGGTDDWFEHANWSAGGVPLAGEHVIITNAANEILLTNSTPNLASFLITNAILTFTNWTTALNASNVTIQSGGELTLPAAFTNGVMSNRVHIVCTNFMLEIGGEIDANGKGYAGGSASAGYGPGGGGYNGRGAGGGYGGEGDDVYAGAASGGGTYGLTNAPVDPGSGGGGSLGGQYGGNGGGAVRIEAAGLVTVYGTITANGGTGGGSYSQGGGSGGGIYITCKQLAGSTNGILSANGGDGSGEAGNWGGGGGGRIAVIYNEAFQTNRPGVRFSTVAGVGVDTSRSGEDGTGYLLNTALLSETLTDELFMNVRLFGITNWSPGNLTVSNCSVTFAEEGFQLTVATNVYISSGDRLGMAVNSHLNCGENLTLNNGTLTLGEFNQGSNSTLNCGGNVTLTNGGTLYIYTGVTNAAGIDYRALVSVTGDIWIASNSWIYPYSHETNGGSVLFKMNNLTIAACGGFDADGKGYKGGISGHPSGCGPGGGGENPGTPDGGWGGSGAGYGGKGGDGYLSDAKGSDTYGSTNAPLSPGSGGGGGKYGDGGDGGGAVRIEAGGIVTVDGTIMANGQDGIGTRSSGGSGGAIYIMCDTFGGSANGVLSANGGDGISGWGGGGGGGRVAVWYGVPENRWEGIRDGNDMRRVSIITNASDYSEFPGTVSVTNGTGWTNLPPDCAYPGTIVFLTVTPPSGTMFMCQ